MQPIKSSYQRVLSVIQSILIKNYLYNVYEKKLTGEIAVTRMFGISNYFQPFIEKPRVIYNSQSGMYNFYDIYLLVSVDYLSESYEICLKTVYKQNEISHRVFESDHIFITGTSAKAEKAIKLVDFIAEESVKSSYLRNRIISIEGSNYGDVDILSTLKIIEPEVTDLDNLFLPKSKKEQIYRFIHEVKCFKDNRISLRYLFNGKPGTGKTQIINSIINEVKGFATVIICNSVEVVANYVFDLCNLFEPCVSIIDDLDFLAENRMFNHNKIALKDFLQALDGLFHNKIFLLTATNDKNLVDEAASRPGRFDMVLDIGKIEPPNYLSLIKRETEDDQIVSFFDEHTLDLMQNNNVTGAFIVSLIKQLRSAKLLKGELTRTDFNEYLDLTHNGFYAYNDDTYVKAVGFGE